MAPAEMSPFEAAGMAATWWDQSVHELQTALSRGWKAVIEAWLTTAEANQDNKGAPDLADQIAVKLLAGSQLGSRTDIAAKLANLNAEITAAEASEADDEAERDALSPGDIRKMKAERTKLKKTLKEIDGSLLATARQSLEAMLTADAPSRAISVLRSRFERLATDHSTKAEREAVTRYDRLIGKYGTTLRSLEAERDKATARIETHLKDLGYG